MDTNQENTKQENPTKVDFYQKFSEKLKDKKSSTLTAKLYSFIEDVRKNTHTIVDLPQKVGQFIQEFEEEFQKIWCEKDDEQIRLNGECIERKICLILYDKLISVIPSDKDKKMFELFETFEFIKPEHLEIPENLLKEEAIEFASVHINKIITYKTPRDKLVSIINCCKFISSMVSHSEDNEERPTGADDFLPCLIYTMLKAKPKNIYTSLQFIKLYRAPDRLRGIDDYYFTAFESVIEFIEYLDVTKLKIDSSEFERLANENRRKLGLSPLIMPKSPDEPEKVNFAADEMKRFTVEVMEKDYNEEIVKDITKKLYYLKDAATFDPKKQKFYSLEPGKILVKEVDELLEDYKKICNMHADVCKKLEEMSKSINEKQQNGRRKGYKKFFGLF